MVRAWQPRLPGHQRRECRECRECSAMMGGFGCPDTQRPQWGGPVRCAAGRVAGSSVSGSAVASVGWGSAVSRVGGSAAEQSAARHLHGAASGGAPSCHVMQEQLHGRQRCYHLGAWRSPPPHPASCTLSNPPCSPTPTPTAIHCTHARTRTHTYLLSNTPPPLTPSALPCSSTGAWTTQPARA